MTKLHSINYYINLMTIGCDGCPAFQAIGSCGIRSFGCSIPKEIEDIESFLESASLSFEDFIGLLEYWEYVESEIFEPIPDPIHDEKLYVDYLGLNY